MSHIRAKFPAHLILLMFFEEHTLRSSSYAILSYLLLLHLS